MGNNMGYLQSACRQHGVIMVGALLALFLVAGCTTHKAENIEPAETSGQDTGIVPRQIQGVSVEKGIDTLVVWIQASEKVEYTSIKQPFPFAVSVYMPDTHLKEGIAPEHVLQGAVSGIKTGYANKEKTTVKVEILLKQDLSYQVLEQGNRLGILLTLPAGFPGDSPADLLGTSQAEQDGLISAVSGQETGSDPIKPMVVPDTPAVMTHIEFDTQSTGRSDIRIITSHPVKYDTRQVSDSVLDLILYNTKVPDHHLRPLLTRYFNSAVERIEPKPVRNSIKDTRIEIQIRDQVPFRIVQNKEGIQMAFEASAVKPPEFGKSKKTLVSGQETMGEKALAPQQTMPGGQTGGPAVSNSVKVQSMTDQTSTEMLLGNAPPVYTGEKIKLDFYDTDIKNVFRILRSVSQLNFAIDKDVQGKVTMSLEEAVPWDQVLDLVLKMNGLGKKMEGNVVRIATIATLQKEEQIVQDAIAARRKTIEDKKSLEPLVTEYIPINYSDATADIQPHVEQLLTKGRGVLSVDQRTNMIIITDTQEKIDQAQDLIFRLDKVTPQIMIEAKVVEVTKEFSRSLGLSWNLSNATATTSGFIDDFGVAVNSAGIAGNFSFFQLFGSSVAALNAQLAASEQLGEVRIVSSPRILTLDNKKAKIKQGREIAYLERDDAGGSSVKFKNVDLLLEVTPHVTPDKRISMTVYLTKNDVAGLTATGVPTLDTNEAETELLVNNNDTVVIGGVVKTTKTKDNDGLPFLAGIPGLGYLFGQEEVEDNRNELLIFLTPSIVQLEQKRNVARPTTRSTN